MSGSNLSDVAGFSERGFSQLKMSILPLKETTAIIKDINFLINPPPFSYLKIQFKT